ncbi:MAG: leucyl aminopeptidase family protein [Candidatus Gracilibacteria bacterium]|nr:leucyl aminopeptidase family protein [Candidatus Gracilibacteria bacterium]
MLNIINNLDDIKNTNLVFLIEEEIDLEMIKIYDFPETIISKLETILTKKENLVFDFYLGNENIEKVYFINFLDKSKKTFIEYISSEIIKLPENLTIISNRSENLEDLLDICMLSRYKFDVYKSDKKEDNISILIKNEEEKLSLENRLATIKNIIDCRNLVSEPTHNKTPEKIVEIIKDTDFRNTKIRILDSVDIRKKGLNLVDAVGKGSENKPYVVIMERIINPEYPTYGFVGKGVVFDTGGLDLKPENHMYNMKDDMAGAASVFYTMKELDQKELKINIIAAFPLVENSVSGNSYRPSDIIKAYNGKTVDVINTDAEGRLVLADTMSYISDNYKLDYIMTVATLTGACMYALGYNYAGIMGNDKYVISKLLEQSKDNSEKYFELPFGNFYIEKTKGEISDLKNLTEGVYAGASMGAAFLSNFCDKGEKFTHIDIAGIANYPESYALYTKGATGFGVDSLSKLFMEL